MRFPPGLLAILLLAVIASPVVAQEPIEREGPLDHVLTTPPCEPCARTTVDFIFGLPTGFRFQRAIDNGRAWHLEGFAGLELIFPMAGGGIRRRYEPLCGKNDALVVAPGVDAYVLYNIFWNSNDFFFGGGPPVAGIVTLDADILWRHSFSERCESQLGLKIGAGVGRGANWGAVPVLSVFTGFRW